MADIHCAAKEVGAFRVGEHCTGSVESVHRRDRLGAGAVMSPPDGTDEVKAVVCVYLWLIASASWTAVTMV
jgi:hypothetical protein